MLDIRPLLWQNGWPVAGENLKEGNYRIQSARTGTALELAVEGVTVGGGRRGGGGGFGGRGGPGGGFGGPGAAGGAAVQAPTGGTNAVAGPGARGGGGGGRGGFGGQGGVIPPQDAATVSSNWPAGNLDARMANYLDQAQQKWTLTAVTNAGGYPGSPYFKITISGTDRTLAATADNELIVLDAFTGAPEQLWRIDQLPDGSWRVMPKSAVNAKEPVALSAIGSSSATLDKFDPGSLRHHWLFKSQ